MFGYTSARPENDLLSCKGTRQSTSWWTLSYTMEWANWGTFHHKFHNIRYRTNTFAIRSTDLSESSGHINIMRPRQLSPLPVSIHVHGPARPAATLSECALRPTEIQASQALGLPVTRKKRKSGRWLARVTKFCMLLGLVWLASFATTLDRDNTYTHIFALFKAIEIWSQAYLKTI